VPKKSAETGGNHQSFVVLGTVLPQWDTELDMRKMEHIFIELTLLLRLFETCSNQILC
jgi:hypothetical protein